MFWWTCSLFTYPQQWAVLSDEFNGAVVNDMHRHSGYHLSTCSVRIQDLCWFLLHFFKHWLMLASVKSIKYTYLWLCKYNAIIIKYCCLRRNITTSLLKVFGEIISCLLFYVKLLPCPPLPLCPALLFALCLSWLRPSLGRNERRAL